MKEDYEIVVQDLAYVDRNFDKREDLQNSTVLVTGCAGFIGFYMMLYLTKFADSIGIKRIIGLDNFRLGEPKWLRELVREFGGRLSLHSFDVVSDDLGAISRVADVNYVIYMASIASPVFYRLYPIETIDATVFGLRRFLDYYKDKRLDGLLFFSSSEVYGDPPPERVPTREDYAGNVPTMGPRACYDESKRLGETLCYAFANRYTLPITIVRPFNNYGPGMKMDDHRVTADFAQSFVQDADIVIRSDGNQTRTFCYVADAVVGYLKALTHGKFDCFNIGIDKPEISIKELALIYLQTGKKFGYKGKIRFEESRDKDYLRDSPSRRCPDVDKARRTLNFNPRIEIREGVGRFIEFLSSQKAQKA